MKARWDSMTPEERREKSNIAALTASASTPRVRKLLSETKMGDRNPMKRPEVAEKVSQTMLEKWSPFFSEQMKRNWREGRIPSPWQRGRTAALPNRAESALVEILASAAPRFRYVGNGAFWIGPCLSGKRRNPDFIDREEKRAILMHGEYWHSETEAAIEVADYESLGWVVMVVWEKELQVRNRTALLGRLGAFLSPAACPRHSSVGRRSSTSPSVRGTPTSRMG
jgi:G:T-mismatch repair DNA endonuclease (very short patch repair protein)